MRRKIILSIKHETTLKVVISIDLCTQIELIFNQTPVANRREVIVFTEVASFGEEQPANEKLIFPVVLIRKLLSIVLSVFA